MVKMHPYVSMLWECITCVAAVEVMHFSCAASAAHFLLEAVIPMDGSLHGYFERQTTEQLEHILYYVANSYVYRPEDIAKDIIKILEQRAKNGEFEITLEQRALWDGYLARATIIQARQVAEGVYDDL